MNATRIAPKTTMFDTVFQGRTGVLGSYLIKGEKTALVDPGPPVQAVQIINEMRRSDMKLDYIALTHIHLDHAAGTWNMLQEHPEAQVVVHPRGAAHMIDPTNLLEAALKQYNGVMPPYGEVHGISPETIIETEDNMNLDLGGVQLRILWTPGHSTHSQSFYEKENGIIFSGDAAGQTRNSIALPTSPPPFNPEQSVESINRMIELNPRMVCVSHFGYRTDAMDFLEQLKNRIMLWEKLSFQCVDAGGDLHKYFDLIYSNDKEVEQLIESSPEAKSDVYGTLVGFLSYTKWKRQQ